MAPVLVVSSTIVLSLLLPILAALRLRSRVLTFVVQAYENGGPEHAAYAAAATRHLAELPIRIRVHDAAWQIDSRETDPRFWLERRSSGIGLRDGDVTSARGVGGAHIRSRATEPPQE